MSAEKSTSTPKKGKQHNSKSLKTSRMPSMLILGVVLIYLWLDPSRASAAPLPCSEQPHWIFGDLKHPERVHAQPRSHSYSRTHTHSHSFPHTHTLTLIYLLLTLFTLSLTRTTGGVRPLCLGEMSYGPPLFQRVWSCSLSAIALDRIMLPKMPPWLGSGTLGWVGNIRAALSAATKAI